MLLKIWEECGGEEWLEVDPHSNLREVLEKWVRKGDYGVQGALVECGYELYGEEEVEKEWTGTVEVEPDHNALILDACGGNWEKCCGGDPDDHDWTSEGEGGCDSNPGVWATGGTSFEYASHCRNCGLRRHERRPGSQRNPGEHNTTEYEMP